MKAKEKTKKSNVLVIVAHCDDELLGAGGYIDKMIAEGNQVFVCCMTSYSDVREEDIDSKMVELHGEIGVKKTYIAPYGASAISNVAHLDKVKFIEGVILETECDTIVTHSDLDLHADHKEISGLTMEAVRIYQRQPTANKIKKVMMMEIPCSGLWGAERFNPNMFVRIDADSIERKIERVSVYDNVIRACPHPRSRENIFALARVRGAMCGVEFAEAFRIVFEKEE